VKVCERGVCDWLTVFGGVHLRLLRLGLLDGLEKFGVQALSASSFYRAEDSSPKLCAVCLFAACSCAFGHFDVSVGISWARERREGGCYFLGGGCWALEEKGRVVPGQAHRSAQVGKRSRNFGGDNAGPGPCPSRVLRLVTLAELWKRSWRCARRESRRQRRRRYNPKSPPQAFICTYTRFPLPAPARPALRCESVPCAVCRRRYLGAVATDVHTIHGKASDR